MTRASKVQSQILSIMRERPPSAPSDYPGTPAAISRGSTFDHMFARRNNGTVGQWLWMAPITAKVMTKHGWIEWHAGSAGKRTGFYVTDAGREVLLT